MSTSFYVNSHDGNQHAWCPESIIVVLARETLHVVGKARHNEAPSQVSGGTKLEKKRHKKMSAWCRLNGFNEASVLLTSLGPCGLGAGKRVCNNKAHKQKEKLINLV